jgi:predicted CopG family antitoxin
MMYVHLKRMAEQESVAKLVRVSDETYRKLQKAQRMRESYGDVVDRAVDALLEKEERQ